ncbi:hypothetical protein Bbelb_033630 [Branchiostoma belcheri]|nr:hypothetical protein Bbelb_033630 [Branchiostoma belcheri]
MEEKQAEEDNISLPLNLLMTAINSRFFRHRRVLQMPGGVPYFTWDAQVTLVGGDNPRCHSPGNSNNDELVTSLIPAALMDSSTLGTWRDRETRDRSSGSYEPDNLCRPPSLFRWSVLMSLACLIPPAFPFRRPCCKVDGVDSRSDNTEMTCAGP